MTKQSFESMRDAIELLASRGFVVEEFFMGYRWETRMASYREGKSLPESRDVVGAALIRIVSDDDGYEARCAARIEYSGGLWRIRHIPTVVGEIITDQTKYPPYPVMGYLN